MIYILPTDTCYWIACPIHDLKAYSWIYKIKKRNPSKALAILIPDFKWLEDNTDLTSEQIEFLKNSIIAKLNSNEKYQIEDFGYLSKDETGKIIFTQTATDFLMPDSVGLTNVTFNSDELNQNSQHKDKNKKVREKKQRIKKTKSDNKTMSGSGKFLKVLVVVLPILALCFVGWYYQEPIIAKGKEFIQKMKKDKKEDIVVDDNKNLVDSNQNQNQNQNQNIFDKDEEYRKILDAKLTGTQEIKLGDNFKKFYIIVGSYKDEVNAQKSFEDLKRQGYDAVILKGNGLNRVSIGGYDKADDFINEYNRAKGKYGNGIWVLINR